MNKLCTRCQKPLGHIAKKVDGKLYHEDCRNAEVEEQKRTWGALQAALKENRTDELARLRADRDRLLAALKFMRRTMYSDTSEESIMADEAIRLAEEE